VDERDCQELIDGIVCRERDAMLVPRRCTLAVHKQAAEDATEEQVRSASSREATPPSSTPRGWNEAIEAAGMIAHEYLGQPYPATTIRNRIRSLAVAPPEGEGESDNSSLADDGSPV